MAYRTLTWVAGAVLVGACAEPTAVSTPELASIVTRDAVPLPTGAIPQTLVERLSSQRVVLFGETHFIREQDDLVFEVVRELYDRGFRQLLLEWPQMTDWLLADFVGDGTLVPDWEPPRSLSGYLLDSVRDFNRPLPPHERIQVRGIDVNLSDYGGAPSFRALMRTVSENVPDPDPIAAFLLGSYSTPTDQRERLDDLREALTTGRSSWVASWGSAWYEIVVEMVEAEIASVPVRALRADHYDMSVRLREDAMKRLADLRIESGGPSVVNVGANHAQKSFLRGTEQEWLGDYLVHHSRAAGGAVFVLAVVPARVQAPSGGAVTDMLQKSPDNEIFRLLHEFAPEDRVFLALDDPQFAEGGVPINFEETIYRCAPKDHFDGLVVLPLAQRIPAS